MAHHFAARTCGGKVGPWNFLPLPFERAATFQNLKRYWGVGFQDTSDFRSFLPQSTKFTSGTILIDQSQIPPQQNGRERKPAKKLAQCDPGGMLPFKGTEAMECSLELRIELS